jgi:hypothetical protein
MGIMFEVSKKYRITTGIGSDIRYVTVRVISIDLPLIEVEGSSGIITIVNTNAPSFHSAEALED